MNNSLLVDLQQQALTENVQKMVVGGVVMIDKKALLLKRSAKENFMPGLIELPSGTVDEGEDLQAALSREIQEETGLSIKKILNYLGSFEYISGSGKKTRQFNFLIEVCGTEIVLNPAEHDSFFWLTVREIKKNKNISDSTKEILLNFLIRDEN